VTFATDEGRFEVAAGVPAAPYFSLERGPEPGFLEGSFISLDLDSVCPRGSGEGCRNIEEAPDLAGCFVLEIPDAHRFYDPDTEARGLVVPPGEVTLDVRVVSCDARDRFSDDSATVHGVAPEDVSVTWVPSTRAAWWWILDLWQSRVVTLEEPSAQAIPPPAPPGSVLRVVAGARVSLQVLLRDPVGAPVLYGHGRYRWTVLAGEPDFGGTWSGAPSFVPVSSSASARFPEGAAARIDFTETTRPLGNAVVETVPLSDVADLDLSLAYVPDNDRATEGTLYALAIARDAAGAALVEAPVTFSAEGTGVTPSEEDDDPTDDGLARFTVAPRHRILGRERCAAVSATVGALTKRRTICWEEGGREPLFACTCRTGAGGPAGAGFVALWLPLGLRRRRAAG